MYRALKQLYIKKSFQYYIPLKIINYVYLSTFMSLIKKPIIIIIIMYIVTKYSEFSEKSLFNNEISLCTYEFRHKN